MTSGNAPTIAGVTELVRIGGGGFSTVYRGRWAADGSLVAVKVLHAPVTDRQGRKQFEKEHAALADMRKISPHVVRLVGHGVLPDTKQPYLVMEYCAGGSPVPGEVELDEIVEIGAVIAQALRDLHRAGRVHRDIKPDNILLTTEEFDREIRLSDFGLSVRLDPNLSRGINAMVPQYAAREVIRHEPHTPASDVYSLGATLYALRMGKPPYPQHRDESDTQYLSRVSMLPEPTMDGFAGPPALRDLVAQMIAVDPARRPTAAQVADGLALLAGPPVPVASHADATRVRAEAQGSSPANSITPGATRPRAHAIVAPAPAVERPVRRVRKGVPVAVAVLLVAGGAMVALWPRGTTPVSTAPPPSAAAPTSVAPAASASAVAIVLDPPTDAGASVDLRWSGPADLQYAVIVSTGETPQPAQLMQRRREAHLTVEPGVPYCFVVQGTNGVSVWQSNPVAIRGAVCRLKV